MKTYVATPATRERNWFVVDAAGRTLGRLATQIADALRGKRKPEFTPHCDVGDFVIVVNAERISVTDEERARAPEGSGAPEADGPGAAAPEAGGQNEGAPGDVEPGEVEDAEPSAEPPGDVDAQNGGATGDVEPAAEGEPEGEA